MSTKRNEHWLNVDIEFSAYKLFVVLEQVGDEFLKFLFKFRFSQALNQFGEYLHSIAK